MTEIWVIEKKTTARAKATADLYGMTNKEQV